MKEPHAVSAEQSRQNRTTERQWQMYASHRRNIERMIVPSQPGGKLCVLGAGNCNDLDLPWLTEVYGEVHLVDLDADALRSAIQRQKLSASKGIVQHAPIDLTGIADRITKWPKDATLEAELRRCVPLLAELPKVPWGLCDTVLSPCVLTQTIAPARDAWQNVLPSDNPTVRAVRHGLIKRHLNIMAASLKPGGRGALALDLVSSEKVPQLARITDAELPAAMDRFIASGKNFRGIDPTAMMAALASIPTLHQIEIHPPWLWHLGLRKSFLVSGVRFTKLIAAVAGL
jgi:hypothetical protein